MDASASLLLKSADPSVRYRARLLLSEEDPRSAKMVQLRRGLKSSKRVTLLLSERIGDGRIPHHPYSKWCGAHWVLASLVDLGYPSGDRSLIPLREQVYSWLLSKEHAEYTEARPYRHHPTGAILRDIERRPRIHGSMEGNAIWYLISLGLFDERGEQLVERLLKTQWPDGGWNCDGDPRALNSSFMETLLPLRALAAHSRATGSSASERATRLAAEIFLKRRLYRRARDGVTINAAFTKLHYPCYWHFDFLFGLKVMAEAGLILDARCRDALDLLESKRLPTDGFPAEAKYYRVAARGSGRSTVDWGPVGPRAMNEFVTLEALWVLKQAGRPGI